MLAQKAHRCVSEFVKDISQQEIWTSIWNEGVTPLGSFLICYIDAGIQGVQGPREFWGSKGFGDSRHLGV